MHPATESPPAAPEKPPSRDTRNAYVPPALAPLGPWHAVTLQQSIPFGP